MVTLLLGLLVETAIVIFLAVVIALIYSESPILDRSLPARILSRHFSSLIQKLQLWIETQLGRLGLALDWQLTIAPLSSETELASVTVVESKFERKLLVFLAWSQRSRVIAGGLMLLVGVLIGITGYYGLLEMFLPVTFVSSFYANVSTELISIGVTVLFIDGLLEQTQMKDIKDQLLRDLVGGIPDFYMRAVQELRVHGWLYDSSLSTFNLAGIKLSRAELCGVNLSNANLTRIDLEGANLGLPDSDKGGEDSLFIPRPKYPLLIVTQVSRRTDLQGAGLVKANLRKADLRGANLRSAILLDADLFEANLSAGEKLIQQRYTLPLFLSEETRIRSIPQSTDLRETVLCYAILVGADLRDADLRDADLRGADLERADLRGCNLSGAILDGGKLLSVEEYPPLRRLENTIAFASVRQPISWLDKQPRRRVIVRRDDSSLQANLNGTLYDNATVWPEGFSPPIVAINVDELVADEKARITSRSSRIGYGYSSSYVFSISEDSIIG